MRILILLGNFYPNMRANGVCTNEVVKQLLEKNHDVHIICHDQEVRESFKNENNLWIHTVKAPILNKYNFLKEREKRSFLTTLKYRISKCITRMRSIIYLPWYPLNSLSLVHRYYKKAQKIHDKEKFDLVLGVYKPIEAIVASTLIKKKNPEIIAGLYMLDTIADNQSNLPLKKWFDKSGFLWEKKLYDINDFNINMENQKNKYELEKYDYFSKKMYFSDIPLFSGFKTISNEEFTEDKKIKMLYAGTLNKKNRNPNYLCQIFSSFKNNQNIELHFYSNGNAEDLISQWRKNNDNIYQHGFVSRKEIEKKVDEADILINIGNKTTDLVPSKIFEYMSTGKKIIHFYKSSSDSSLSYLDQYPKALLVDERKDFKYNLKVIEEFIRKSNFEIDQKLVEKKFVKNRPEFTASLIEELGLRLG